MRIALTLSFVLAVFFFAPLSFALDGDTTCPEIARALVAGQQSPFNSASGTFATLVPQYVASHEASEGGFRRATRDLMELRKKVAENDREKILGDLSVLHGEELTELRQLVKQGFSDLEARRAIERIEGQLERHQPRTPRGLVPGYVIQELKDLRAEELAGARTRGLDTARLAEIRQKIGRKETELISAIHVIATLGEPVQNDSILTPTNDGTRTRTYVEPTGRYQELFHRLQPNYEGKNFGLLGDKRTVLLSEAKDGTITRVTHSNGTPGKVVEVTPVTISPSLGLNPAHDAFFLIEQGDEYHAKLIEKYLNQLWDQAIRAPSPEKALPLIAEFEWWFMSANPTGRGGASIGDALSTMLQRKCGIPVRAAFRHVDFDVLSAPSLDAYLKSRVDEVLPTIQH